MCRDALLYDPSDLGDRCLTPGTWPSETPVSRHRRARSKKNVLHHQVSREYQTRGGCVAGASVRVPNRWFPVHFHINEIFRVQSWWQAYCPRWLYN